MKKFALSLALGVTIATIAILPISASLATPTATPNPSLYSAGTPSPTPESHSGESNEPEHRIRHEDNGLEIIPLAVVLGAIIIAVGLAVGIGRRRTRNG
jgi:hypothetical protein